MPSQRQTHEMCSRKWLFCEGLETSVQQVNPRRDGHDPQVTRTSSGAHHKVHRRTQRAVWSGAITGMIQLEHATTKTSPTTDSNLQRIPRGCCLQALGTKVNVSQLTPRGNRHLQNDPLHASASVRCAGTGRHTTGEEPLLRSDTWRHCEHPALPNGQHGQRNRNRTK